jgi:glycosyltransferase involved in cell wall biosynthesis
MKEPFFTVCTPTYNRGYALGRAYESLLGQSYRDFEWLVVDDGSTDNTEQLVRSWMEAAPFPIRYVRQENQHKKTALNTGVRHARGELFLCLDSDDALTPDALAFFREYWLDIPADERPEFVGLRALCERPDGAQCGSAFSADVLDGSFFDEFHKRGIGETLPCERVDVLRQFPFPEHIAGFVPESVVQSPLALRYKTRMLNRVARIYYDDEFSLTRNAHPATTGAEGSALWMATCLSDHIGWFRDDPTYFIKSAAHYTRFHLHMLRSGKRRFYPVRGYRAWLLALAASPIGVLLFLRDMARTAAGPSQGASRAGH